jgi:hypothetical protein
VLYVGGIGHAAETQLLLQIVFAEVMALEDIVPRAPVLDKRLTMPFDPAGKERPLKSEQTQAAVQKGEEKSRYDGRAELFGAIDRTGHHRREKDGENEIEGCLFREKALVREPDNNQRSEENHDSAECDLKDCEVGSFHADTKCRKKVVHHPNKSSMHESMSVKESIIVAASGTAMAQEPRTTLGAFTWQLGEAYQLP